MLVDHERVVLALKARIREESQRGKRSWGERELLALLADLEVEHRTPEGQEGFDDRPVPVSRGLGGRPETNEAAATSGEASQREPVGVTGAR